jgi:hypothetical protein
MNAVGEIQQSKEAGRGAHASPVVAAGDEQAG